MALDHLPLSGGALGGQTLAADRWRWRRRGRSGRFEPVHVQVGRSRDDREGRRRRPVTFVLGVAAPHQAVLFLRSNSH